MLRHEFRMAFHRKEIYFIITIGIVLSVIGLATTGNLSTITLSRSHSAFQTALVYGANALQILYVLLIPIIASLSYTDNYVFEKKNGLDSYLLIRQKRKNGYFLSKGIVVTLLAFFLTILPLLLNQIWCLLAFPLEAHQNFQGNTPYDGNFYRELGQIVNPGLAINHPLSANVLHIALYGLYGSALAAGTYAITLYMPKNRAAVIALPIAAALSLEILGLLISTDIMPSNSLVVYSYSQRTSMWPMGLLIGGILIASFICIITRGLRKTDEIAVK